jgi:hypothetical protein
LRLPLWLPLTAFTLVSAVPAHATLADYLAARKQFPPRAGLTAATVQKNPAAYLNNVLEVRGVVSGVSRSGDGITVLIRSGDSSVMVRGSEGADVPGSGEYVRALVTVEDGGDYSLLSMVSETEIGARNIDPPVPTPSTAKAKTKLPTKWPVSTYNRASTSSRGVFQDPRVLSMYKQVVEAFNPKLSEAQATIISRSVIESSYKQGVDARFIMAIFAAESGFKPKAKSRVGAMGIGQLMPGTARGLGVKNAYDPAQNIQGAVKLLQKHWLTYSKTTDDFGKFISLVCAAYNAGPGAVKKYGGVPPYKETRQYIQRVSKYYSIFAPELFQ